MNLRGGICRGQPIPERTNWVWRTSSCWPLGLPGKEERVCLCACGLGILFMAPLRKKGRQRWSCGDEG